MVLTNDSGFAETLRLLRGHGAERQYYHRLVGTNSRLDTLQAAILLAKFGHLEEWTRRRRDNAEYYASRLAGSGLNAPYVALGGTHVFNQFTIRVPNRDSVRQRMDARGVATAIYYPVPLHLQECFASLGYKQGDLPASEQAASEVLSIPIDPELTPEEREIVVEALLASV
jgi:dTDP-4-amino-4,6-dideoxygalactose transaminase